MSNLDEALERFHLADLEYAGGLSNHGPMGAIALEDLGHQALIPAFLDLYVPRLPPARPGRLLGADERSSALGCAERGSDWVATFELELAGGDWRALLPATIEGLLPGLFAGAGHGLLRTAHAVRALERVDSPLRRRELARGLAHWAARYQPLPGRPGARPRPDRSLEESFEALPRLGDPALRDRLFAESVRALDDRPAFEEAIETITPPPVGACEAFLDRLARLGAGLYAAHPEARIAYVHLVTWPAAMRGLLPYLDPERAPEATLFVVQAMAALHAVQGERGPGRPEDEEVLRTAESWDEIRYRAACSIQEHAIKMAEACWRSDRLAPDPIFRLAAADAALRLEGTRSAGGC